MYDKQTYIDFFLNKNTKLDFSLNELLSNYKEYCLNEDKLIILEALSETIDDIKHKDIQPQHFNTFISDFDCNDVYTSLLVKYIKYVFYALDNTRLTIEDSLYKLKLSNTKEILELLHLLSLFEDGDKSAEILNCIKNVVECLEVNKGLTLGDFYKYEYITKFIDKVNTKLLNKDTLKLLNSLVRLKSRLVKDIDIKRYKYKEYELYLINFHIGKELSLNSKELLISKFILSCLKSEDIINPDDYTIIQKYYSRYFIYSKKKNDVRTINEYLERNFNRLGNIANYPFALELIGMMYPVFYEINIDNSILENVKYIHFMEIFKYNIYNSDRDNILKSIEVFNKRFRIDLISELFECEFSIYNIGNKEIKLLLENNIIDYTKVNYNSKNSYLVRCVLDAVSDIKDIKRFNIFHFIVDNYSVKCFNDIKYDNSIFSKDSFLSREQAQYFFRNLCDYTFFNRSVSSFYNLIYNIFLLDKEFYLFDKEIWKSVIDKMIEMNVLSYNEILSIKSVLLTPEEYKIFQQKQFEESAKKRENEIMISINDITQIYDLYMEICYKDEDWNLSILTKIRDKLEQLLENENKTSFKQISEIFYILAFLHYNKVVDKEYILSTILKIERSAFYAENTK